MLYTLPRKTWFTAYGVLWFATLAVALMIDDIWISILVWAPFVVYLVLTDAAPRLYEGDPRKDPGGCDCPQCSRYDDPDDVV